MTQQACRLCWTVCDNKCAQNYNLIMHMIREHRQVACFTYQHWSYFLGHLRQQGFAWQKRLGIDYDYSKHFRDRGGNSSKISGRRVMCVIFLKLLFWLFALHYAFKRQIKMFTV